MRYLFVFLTLVFVTGCSTVRPYHSGRQGMLDRFGHYESAHGPRAGRPVKLEHRQPSSFEFANFRKKARNLRWPLDAVEVTSNFGARYGDFHEGIDLRARSGTPVRAADHGKVAYSGSKISGYGKMVVIRHPSGLSTVYAHNSRLVVKTGQTVKRGQKIAFSGNTGRSSGPHVHFEVRHGVQALDPKRLLPNRSLASRSTR